MEIKSSFMILMRKSLNDKMKVIMESLRGFVNKDSGGRKTIKQ